MGEEDYDLREMAWDALQRAKERTRKMLKMLVVVGYVVVAFLVFGWTYNHPNPTYARCADPKVNAEHLGWCTGSGRQGHILGSVVAGAVWPIYLSGSVGIALTKWP